MKAYGTRDSVELASLSSNDSNRRAKAARSRARQGNRLLIEAELLIMDLDCEQGINKFYGTV